MKVSLRKGQGGMTEKKVDSKPMTCIFNSLYTIIDFFKEKKRPVKLKT